MKTIDEIEAIYAEGRSKMTDGERLDLISQKGWLDRRELATIKGRLAGETFAQIGSTIEKVGKCPVGQKYRRRDGKHYEVSGWNPGDIGITSNRTQQIFKKVLRRLRWKIFRNVDPTVVALCVFESDKLNEWLGLSTERTVK